MGVKTQMELILIITININDLSTSSKRQKLPGEMKEQDPSRSCLQEKHFKYKNVDQKEKDLKRHTT